MASSPALSAILPEPARSPLRIGVAVDSNAPPAWIASVIDEFQRASFLRVSVFLARVASERQGDTELEPSSALFRRYLEWDKPPQSAGLDPFRPTQLNGDLCEPPLASSAVRGISRISERPYDAVMWFSAEQPDDAIYKNSRFGVYRYRHGESSSLSSRAAYFRNLYNRNPVSKSVLERSNSANSSPTLISESNTSTIIGWSLSRDSAPFWKASALILKSFRHLYESRLSESESEEPPPAGTSASGKSALESSRIAPGNGQMLRFLFRNAVRTLERRLIYSSLEPSWFIAYRTVQGPLQADSILNPGPVYRPVKAPPGHFFADPFIVPWKGEVYVLVEDYVDSSRKGVISALKLSDNGELEWLGQALERPYHLSYPFTFEHEGTLYMIPETFFAGRIELYRSKGSPLEWEFVQVLKDNLAGADTTVWIDNGIFYFFTSTGQPGIPVNETLHLFYSDSLTGEWQPHPQNPICSDVRRSRSAGRLFKRAGKLIRPSQDCSVRYGYACQLNEVDVLSPDCYHERPIERIEPDWVPGLIGTHTFNSGSGIEVIDGQIYRPRPSSRFPAWSRFAARLTRKESF